MVKDVIIFFFGGVYNRFVFDSDGVNFFNFDRVKVRKYFYRVYYVSYFFQTFVERVKFIKDVVFIEFKLSFIRVFSEFFFGFLELFLVFFVQLDVFV